MTNNKNKNTQKMCMAQWPNKKSDKVQSKHRYLILSSGGRLQCNNNTNNVLRITVVTLRGRDANERGGVGECGGGIGCDFVAPISTAQYGGLHAAQRWWTIFLGFCFHLFLVIRFLLFLFHFIIFRINCYHSHLFEFSFHITAALFCCVRGCSCFASQFWCNKKWWSLPKKCENAKQHCNNFQTFSAYFRLFSTDWRCLRGASYNMRRIANGRVARCCKY